MNRSAGVSLSEHFEPGGAIRVAHVLETTVDRAEKREMVGFLEEVFADSGSVVVTQYIGLTVAEMTDLRRQMKDAGAKFKVIKNRLAKIALENGDRSVASEMFKGPVGIAYGIDPVAAPKVLTEYAKKNEKLVIIGGAMGAEVFDAEGVRALAKMPSREEVIASIVGALMAPASNLAGAITAPASNIAGILKTIAEKEDA